MAVREMNWVREKEDWLVDWADATCLNEISFEHPSSTQFWPRLANDEAVDVFFADVIEAHGRCLVCRAGGSTVDIFDISPSTESLLSWKVQLPSPVVPDIGVVHVQDAGGLSLSIMFLTKAHVIHTLRVSLYHTTPDLLVDGSVTCAFSSPPSSFCALDRDFVAVGCFNGTLHTVRLGPGNATYELQDSSLVRRIMSGIMQATAPPPVVALASIGPNRMPTFASGFCLLSFSADGKLRLWEALQNRGNLITSQALFPSPQDQHALSVLGTCSAYIRVSPSCTKACLVLRHSIMLVQLPRSGPADSLAVREIEPPFPSATPSLVSLSHGALWSFWSGQSREQLFRLDLEEPDLLLWQSKALDAGLVEPEIANSRAALHRVAVEGCSGRTTDASVASHMNVFTLFQQQEVWRAEEDGFDACQVVEMFERLRQQGSVRGATEPITSGSSYSESFTAGHQNLDDVVLHWWLDRIFLPGRFSNSVIAMALREAGGHLAQQTTECSFPSRSLRGVVEDHLRRQVAAQRREDGDVQRSDLRSAAAWGVAARELLRICSAIWMRKHQVCGMAASTAWGPHAWHPAGSAKLAAHLDHSAGVCPLLLCHGGVACVRPVHSWPERWWTTLHLMRDLSNYEPIEVDDMLRLSMLDEWKLCATAWFLSQCIGHSGFGLAVSLLRPGVLPSQSLHCFAGGLRQHLAVHLAQCMRSLADSGAKSQLISLRELLQLACSPDQQLVTVASKLFDRTSGIWSEDRRTPEPSGARTLTRRVCLSDVLRGSIAVRECEYLCAAMRDLLLLCGYINQDEMMPGDPEVVRRDWQQELRDPAWTAVAQVLDEQWLKFTSLHHSMQLELPVSEGAVTTRGCDAWASTYRTTAEEGGLLALRPPTASFRSLQFAMQLLRHECWDALRWWSLHHEEQEFSAYLAGRQWIATGRSGPAREAFIHAENVANIVMEALRVAGLTNGPCDGPDIVMYYVHVAGLFSTSQGSRSDEYIFLKKAAHLAEELSHSGCTHRDVCQRLWSTAFEKAVNLEMWEEAHDALLRIDAFENCLRRLGQTLRSKGRIDVLMRLPEKHRTLFLSHLHEQALSPPTLESDSLACFQSLYAFHFSGQQYVQAAAVAHCMYSSLRSTTSTADLSPPQSSSSAACESLQGGECISKTGDVPMRLMEDPVLHGRMSVDSGAEHSTSATSAMDCTWSLLEQQRSALLMLISALTLTHEKVLLLPSTRNSVDARVHAHGGDFRVAARRGAGSEISASELQGMRDWFLEAEKDATRVVFTLSDAERLLSITEANMVLSGKCDTRTPTEVAHRVAGLGLLGLSLQVSQACNLNLWQHTLRPFLQLCMESEQCSDDRVAALADAARGPAQVFMFVQSDGCTPLGCGGSVRGGLWQMLEEGLATVCRSRSTDTVSLDASSAHLYALVADEILSSPRNVRLPDFIISALAQGPSWVCLLRMYLKHALLQDAVDLLDKQLKVCRPRGDVYWTPLQDFPAQLVVQLQEACARQQANDAGDSERASRRNAALEATVSQFQWLLGDVEKHPL